MIRTRQLAIRSALVLTLVMLGGCRERAAQAPESAPEPGVRPAQALPIPGAQGALPEGHPPVESTTSGRGVTWDAPPTWVETEPSSPMRVAQYRIDGAGGTAECVVYYFGPNQGGSATANAERWAGQFTQPDGSSSLDRMKVSAIDRAGGPAQLVEVTGTYDGGMTMTDIRLLEKRGGKWRAMPHVLAMSARQFRYPMLGLILLETDNCAFLRHPRRPAFAPRPWQCAG